MPFSVYSTREQLSVGHFFFFLQNHIQNKNERGKGKQNNTWRLKIELWIKWTGIAKIKHEDFIGDVPIIPCQNSSCIMGLRIYGEGITQVLLSLPATIGPLPRIQDRQGLF